MEIEIKSKNLKNPLVAMGNHNYATGDTTIALGKENWA
jgi:hypothetical protein